MHDYKNFKELLSKGALEETSKGFTDEIMRRIEAVPVSEKGMNPNLAKSDFWIQIGIIAAGASSGLILGGYLPTKFGYGPLIAIMFAGIGLVVYNIYRKRKSKI